MISEQQQRQLAEALREHFTFETLRRLVAGFSRDVAHAIDEHVALAEYCHLLIDRLEQRGLLSAFGEYLSKLPELRRERSKILRWFRHDSVGPGESAGLVGPPCPYPGLRAFTGADTDFFVGREAEVAELRELAESRRWISIEGPSGVGKSSLVHAGLLPRLPAAWHVLTLSSVTHPWDSLIDALWSAQPAAGRPTRQGFRVDPQGLRDFVYERTRDGSTVVLVMDQLQEMLAFAEPDQVRSLVAALERALSEDALRFRLVTTIRSDQVGGLGALGGQLNQPWVARYMVGPMSNDDLEHAIAEPAALRGVRIQEGLAATIRSDAMASPDDTFSGGLALIAELMRELWHACTGADELTLEAYHRLGRIDGTLTRAADRTLQTIQGRGAAALARVRGLLLDLTTLDGSGRATLRAIPLATARELLHDDDELLALLAGGGGSNAAAHLRLIAVSGTGSAARVSLVSGRLPTAWPTLRGWYAEVAETKRLRQQFRETALWWDKNGRNQESLPSGELLMQFRELRPDAEDLEVQDAFQDALWKKSRQLRDEARRRRRRTVMVGSGILVGLMFIVLAVKRRFELEAMLVDQQRDQAEIADLRRELQRAAQQVAAADAARLSAVEVEGEARDDLAACEGKVGALQRDLGACRRGSNKSAPAAPAPTCEQRRISLQAHARRATREHVQQLFDCWTAAGSAAADERVAFQRFLAGAGRTQLLALVRAVARELPASVAWRTQFLR